MSPNGTHPRLKVKEPRSGRSEHRPACCQAQMRTQCTSGEKNALATHERLVARAKRLNASGGRAEAPFANGRVAGRVR